MNDVCYGLRNCDERNNAAPLKVKMAKFEGMMHRIPLERYRDKQLDFIFIHHDKRSEGGYEVTRGKKVAKFYNLEDAVNYYNSL